MFVDSERGKMMDNEARNHEFTETSTLESGREASDAGRSSKNRQHGKRGLPARMPERGRFLLNSQTNDEIYPILRYDYLTAKAINHKPKGVTKCLAVINNERILSLAYSS